MDMRHCKAADSKDAKQQRQEETLKIGAQCSLSGYRTVSELRSIFLEPEGHGSHTRTVVRARIYPLYGASCPQYGHAIHHIDSGSSGVSEPNVR